MNKKKNIYIMIFFAILFILGLDLVLAIIENNLESSGQLYSTDINYILLSNFLLNFFLVVGIIYISIKCNINLDFLSYKFDNNTAIFFILIILISPFLNYLLKHLNHFMMNYLPTFDIPNEYSNIIHEKSSTKEKVLLLVSYGVFTGIGEEFFFRGICYQALRLIKPVFGTVLINCIIFVLFHPIPAFIPSLIITNVILCLSCEYTKSLLLPTLLHIIFNSTPILLS